MPRAAKAPALIEGAGYWLTQAICGAVLGLAAGAVMLSIAVPNAAQLLLPWEMAEDLERLGELHRALAAPGWAWALCLSLAAAVSWILSARRLNPHLPPFPFLKARKPGLAWAAVLLAGSALWGGVFLSLDSPSGDFFGSARAGRPGPLAASILACALAWWMISPRGWAGRFEAWKPHASWRDWLQSSALGAAFGVVMGLGAYAAQRLFFFLFFLNVAVWAPGAELAYDPALRTIVLLVAIGALSTSAGFSLVPVFAVDGSKIESRLRRAAPPLAVAVLTAGAALLLHRDAVSRHDWRAHGLAGAASLPPARAEDLVLVTLGHERGKPLVIVKPWEMQAGYWSFGAPPGVVPASEENARALMHFASGPGRESRFRNSAMDAVFSIYTALWDPQALWRSHDELGASYPLPILRRLLELHWLCANAPITGENRARLERISDAKRLRIPGRAAAKLARAWLRFGDVPRAGQWLEKARAGGATPEDLEGLDLSSGQGLAAGVVRGRVSASGLPPGRIKVGLFRVHDKAESAGPPSRGQLAALADAQWAGADGSFEFRNLSEGRYSISLLLPRSAIPDGVKEVAATPHPGLIRLSRGRPRREAGPIALKFRI